MNRDSQKAAILGVMTTLAATNEVVNNVLDAMIADRTLMEGHIDFLISKVRFNRSQYVFKRDVEFWCTCQLKKS